MENRKGFYGTDLKGGLIKFIGNLVEGKQGKIMGLVDYKDSTMIVDQNVEYLIGIKNGNKLKLIKFGLEGSLERLILFELEGNEKYYEGSFRKLRVREKRFINEINIREKIKNGFYKNKGGPEDLCLEILNEISYDEIKKYIENFSKYEEKLPILLNISKPFRFKDEFLENKNKPIKKGKLLKDLMNGEDRLATYRGLV